jgi:hypothetical protein
LIIEVIAKAIIWGFKSIVNKTNKAISRIIQTIHCSLKANTINIIPAVPKTKIKESSHNITGLVCGVEPFQNFWKLGILSKKKNPTVKAKTIPTVDKIIHQFIRFGTT